MTKIKFIQYFVEGDCEQKFINVFKNDKGFLKAGKVEVLNAVNQYISDARARTIKQNTLVVFVYDVDKGNLNVLEKNIQTLKKHSISTIIHIQSIKNFEDEIVYSTSVKKIDDVFNTVGVDNFKVAFLEHKDILSKLKQIRFDNNKMWSRIDKTTIFKNYSNASYLPMIRR